MRHWQVLQLQQHLHAYIYCTTCNNDSNHVIVPAAPEEALALLAAAAATGQYTIIIYVQNRRVAVKPPAGIGSLGCSILC